MANDTILLSRYERLGNFHLNTAKVFLINNNSKDAIKNYYYALNYFEKSKNKNKLAECYKNLGNTQIVASNFSVALKFFGNALEKIDQSNPTELLSTIYSDMGNCHLHLNNLPLAYSYLTKATNFFSKINKNDKLCLCYIRLAVYYSKKNNNTLALTYLMLASEKNNKDKKNKEWVIYNNIGHIYTELKQLDSAEKYLKNAYDCGIKINNPRALEIVSLSLYEYYLLINNHKQALKFLKINQEYSNLLKHNESRNLIILSELELRTKNELLKYKLEKLTQSNLNNQKLYQQKYFYLSFLIALGILLITTLAVFFYKQLQQRIKKANLQVIEQQQKVKLITEIQENERQIIARDLHDSIGAQVASIKYGLSNYKNETKTENQLLKNLLIDVDQLATSVRTISHRMLPLKLYKKGLVYAIEDLLFNLLNSVNIYYKFEHKIDNVKLNQTILICIYRVLEELIVNILKHANCDNVQVTLYNTENSIILIVEDNGIGMSEKFSDGIGLSNISNRVESCNGTFTYENGTANGITSIVKIPLNT